MECVSIRAKTGDILFRGDFHFFQRKLETIIGERNLKYLQQKYDASYEASSEAKDNEEDYLSECSMVWDVEYCDCFYDSLREYEDRLIDICKTKENIKFTSLYKCFMSNLRYVNPSRNVLNRSNV